MIQRGEVSVDTALANLFDSEIEETSSPTVEVVIGNGESTVIAVPISNEIPENPASEFSDDILNDSLFNFSGDGDDVHESPNILLCFSGFTCPQMVGQFFFSFFLQVWYENGRTDFCVLDEFSVNLLFYNFFE